MKEILSIEIRGEVLHLHPNKGIYWELADILLIADAHLGKAGHFRREGIPIPEGVSTSNWKKLNELLNFFEPGKVLFLGDLFHSTYNQEWEDFGKWMNGFPEVNFQLIPGNHDLLSDYQYDKFELERHHDPLIIPPFIFSHAPLKKNSAELYNLAGHIHPAVKLRGSGKQSLRMACFYFGSTHGLLPAFGSFTGMYTLQPRAGDQVFVVTPKKVLPV